MPIERQNSRQMGADGHESHLGNGELPHCQGEIHAQRHDDIDTNIGEDSFRVGIEHEALPSVAQGASTQVSRRDFLAFQQRLSRVSQHYSTSF